MFSERASWPGSPPRSVHVLRFVGGAALLLCVISALTTAPRDDVGAGHVLVGISLALFCAGCTVVFFRKALPTGVRFGGLLALALGSAALLALQPDTPAVAGTYLATVIAVMRLERRAAFVVAVVGVGAAVAAYLSHPGDATGNILALLFSIIPWIVVIGLMRSIREERDHAAGLVEELRASREAEADAAAEAERGRLARDMHDVLAHSLSALSLQLEGARLLARDRGTDPEVVAALERAHHLAAGGLDEARRAIGALRGEDLPGPDGLAALAEAFTAGTGVPCRVVTEGEPVPLPSEARLALYRTAQEALTNVRRHAAPDEVTVRLAYEPAGTRLVVADAGAAIPVSAAPSPGGGFGLTGMRERAELLGGELAAGPTADGFRVELWLPR
jgi:signal transduction histidine kinase